MPKALTISLLVLIAVGVSQQPAEAKRKRVKEVRVNGDNELIRFTRSKKGADVLRCSRISDQGLKALQNLTKKARNRIVRVDLRNCNMLTDDGLRELRFLPKIRFLSIEGCKNGAIRRSLVDAEDSLLAGKSLTESLAQSQVLPRLFVELVMIGEESNSLQRTMKDAADTYEAEFERRISGFIAVLEPASTVVVGAIVAFIAFSMFVPIYSSLDAFE